MNQNIYNYVNKITNRIKHKNDIEDVVQNVLMILCEKNLINNELNDTLKNYIKGIVFNQSVTFYKAIHQNQYELSPNITYKLTDEADDTNNDHQVSELYSTLKTYVFRQYYSRGKNITRWKVYYLRLKGWNYNEIFARLGISYKTAIQYFYLCDKEINGIMTYK
ncbi:RNA polymerase sigma factor [Echinicola shivajiensis]|uniref:RNA polymerase sigma factor n=1 Tax=Echinicola shivajiensis TaxID=1035916 RepID=UPI001BFCC197|nr:hypothetical protein [Echinicola shivajiensis]